MSVLSAVNVTKIYPGTVALDDVSISFESGTVNAFVGKNGSGKSTLLKIFSGAVEKTKGRVEMDGKEMKIETPTDALESGIATVYQELSLANNLTVMENIFLGRLPMKRGVVDWKETERRSQEVLDELNLGGIINPTDVVGHLPQGKRQMVEIAKAMSFNPKVIQLDEPTSSLAREETESLFEVIRYLKSKDVIVIYVTHKLHELWKVCDTCTVLRDGKFIGKVDLKEADNTVVLGMMFGDVQIRTLPEDLKVGEGVVLKVENLGNGKKFRNINFELHEGEILGIAGMLGSGRTELLSSIFGSDSYDEGIVTLMGEEIPKPTPEIMTRKGLGMIQEDRQRHGITRQHTIKQNITRACIYKLGKGFLVDEKLEDELARKQVEDLDIKIASIDDLITTLSGGNMQKVVVGNWLNTNPKVMFLDEPSRGIDVNAKQQIFEIMWNMARNGIPSVVVSTELEELIEICHRILVIKDGEFIDEVYPENLTVEKLYSLCMGEN
jgi:ribose transport system ATP-binding protein